MFANMMVVSALLLVLLVSIVNSLHVGSPIGGKRSIEMPPNEQVVGAAEFGAKAKYHSLHPSVSVISGTQQVVSGLSYDLKVAVTRRKAEDSSDTECTVDKMVVGSQPWKSPKYTLYSFARTEEACP